MYKNDEELISAYLDNELDEKERKQVEDRLGKDEAFATAFASFEMQDSSLIKAYSKIDNKPLSPELDALVQSLKAPQETPTSKKSSGWKTLLPIAASIAMVAVLAPFFIYQEQTPVITQLDALNTIPSGQTITIKNEQRLFLSMSFKDSAQRWCREYFVDRGNQSSHEIACKSGNQWQTEISVDAEFPDANQFMPASSNTALIDSWIDSNIEGDVLSIEQENALVPTTDR